MSEINKENEVLLDELNDIETSEEVVEDKTEDISMLEILNNKAQIQEMSNALNKMKDDKERVLDGNDELSKKLDEYVRSIESIEDIKKLSLTEVQEIFTIDGEIVELNIEDEAGNKVLDFERSIQFKKDFLEYVYESDVVSEKYRDVMNEAQDELVEYDEKLGNMLESYGSIPKMIRLKMVNNLETVPEDQKEKVETQIKYFDYGLNLNNVEDYVNSLKGKNILYDYSNIKNSLKIKNKAIKRIEILDLKEEITKFSGLEAKFLPMDYQKRKDIFLFTILHYISSWDIHDSNTNNGIFLSHFMLNLKDLFFDKFENEEVKDEFLDSIKRIMDIRFID